MSRYIPKGSNLPLWRPPAQLRPQLAALGPRIEPLLRDPVLFLQTFISWEGEPLVLDGWQVAFLRRRQRFRALEKSVQIGFSWICAAEAFHRAFVYEDDESSFVSISESEAKNKVQYVRKLMEGLEPWLAALVPIPVRSREEVWFGSEGRPSIIRSLPAVASLRGRATHIYIDEIDHFRSGQDKDIFTAAIGRVTRNHRRLTIGSSVFGEDTVLSRIMAPGVPGEPNRYPDFLKASLPWWVTENQSAMDSIHFARRNMPPEDFAQEYECKRAASIDSMFPQDFVRASWHDRRIIPHEELADKGSYLAGYDPGTSAHPASLTVFDQHLGAWSQVVLEKWRGRSLTRQQASLEKLLSRCQGLTLAIDRGGLGIQMADYLEDAFGPRVVPVNFTQKGKYDMAMNLRMMLENEQAKIAHDIDLAHQMNRTKRITGGKLDQPSMGKRTHYDEFWATALALSLAAGEGTSVYEERGLLFLDADPELINT